MIAVEVENISFRIHAGHASLATQVQPVGFLRVGSDVEVFLVERMLERQKYDKIRVLEWIGKLTLTKSIFLKGVYV